MQLKSGVIILGLTNSGKTTIVHTLTNEPTDMVVPTVGFSIEKFKYQKAKLTVMDMSGATKYQPLWEHYYKDAQVSCISMQHGNVQHIVLHMQACIGTMIYDIR